MVSDPSPVASQKITDSDGLGRKWKEGENHNNLRWSRDVSFSWWILAGPTRLELATSGVTGIKPDDLSRGASVDSIDEEKLRWQAPTATDSPAAWMTSDTAGLLGLQRFARLSGARRTRGAIDELVVMLMDDGQRDQRGDDRGQRVQTDAGGS
jgi:hypothetical protein